MCSEDEVEIFIGTGALLGIFACICRQRPIIHCIHWWKWRSRAPQLDTTGVDAAKIKLEFIEFQQNVAVKEIYLEATPENFLSKEGIFPLLANSH